MVIRKFLVLTLTILISFSILQNNLSYAINNSTSEENSSTSIDDKLNFAFIVNNLEEYQQSYIDQIYDVAQTIAIEYNATASNITIVGPRIGWETNFNNILFSLAYNGTYDVIFVIGRMACDDYISRSIRSPNNFRVEYPTQHIVLIDSGKKDRDNNLGSYTTTIEILQEQGSFLAGALTARTTEEDKYGIIVNYSNLMGNEIFIYEETYLEGWIAGIKYIKPNAQVDVKSLKRGNLGEDGVWDPVDDNLETRGIDAINYLADQGIKTICVIAGNASNAIYDTAKTRGVNIIAVDSNENHESSVILSIEKNITRMILDVVNFYNSSDLTSWTKDADEFTITYSLGEGINLVDYNGYINNLTIDEAEKEEIRIELELWQTMILNGSIVVPKIIQLPNAPGFTVVSIIYSLPIIIPIIWSVKKKKKK